MDKLIKFILCKKYDDIDYYLDNIKIDTQTIYKLIHLVIWLEHREIITEENEFLVIYKLVNKIKKPLISQELKHSVKILITK